MNYLIMKIEKDEISITKVDLARGYQRLGQNITRYEKDWHEGIGRIISYL